MKRRIVLSFLLLPLVTAGCANDEAEALRAEIKKLKDERVETTVVEKARQETTDAEAAVAASKAERDEAQAAFAKLEADRDATRAALDAESARNANLRAEIDAVGQRAQERAARGQELDQRIAAARQHATFVRDQADVLAREIRPEDATWASARRLASLAEFTERVAKQYPDDPVLAELAHAAVRSGLPSADQVRAASERAARVRDRVAAVYDLPPPAVAASAQAAPETRP